MKLSILFRTDIFFYTVNIIKTREPDIHPNICLPVAPEHELVSSWRMTQKSLPWPESDACVIWVICVSSPRSIGSDFGRSRSSGLISVLDVSWPEFGVAKIWSGSETDWPRRPLLVEVSSCTGIPLWRPVTGSILCSLSACKRNGFFSG